MLIGFLTTIFFFMCLLLVLLILIQRGKSSIGIGAVGGGAQMLFGGSGGQDIFQKATWIMVAIFMFGSLGLAILKTRTISQSRYFELTQRPQTPRADFPIEPFGDE